MVSCSVLYIGKPLVFHMSRTSVSLLSPRRRILGGEWVPAAGYSFAEVGEGISVGKEVRPGYPLGGPACSSQMDLNLPAEISLP